MTTYELNIDTVNTSLTYTQREKYIYGSSRLGMLKDSVNVLGSAFGNSDSTNVAHTLGNKRYEFSNHLGNVLAVISDKPIPHDNGGTIDYWQANIISTSDYSPFGVTLSGRSFDSESSYRYSFQGQEKDDEIKGEGNSINYKYRMHDPRLGRFFAVDPLASKYPHNGSYNFSENIVIHGVELEGLEVVVLSKFGGVDLLVGTAEAGGGVAFGPNGVSGVGTYSYGFQIGTLAGASTGFSATIFPDMRNTKNAAGKGRTSAIGFDLPIGGGITIGAVEALDSYGNVTHTGIVIKVAMGAGVTPLGVNASYTWDETVIKSLGKEEKGVMKEAMPLLKTIENNIHSTLSGLYESNKVNRAEYRKYLDKNGKIDKSDSKYEKYKKAYDKVVENNSQIKTLEKSVEVVKKAIDEN